MQFTRHIHACIGVSKKKGRTYAELIGDKVRISLGRIDHTSPTYILDVCLSNASKLTLAELEHLLIASKEQRDLNRRPGRPRKSTRL